MVTNIKSERNLVCDAISADELLGGLTAIDRSELDLIETRVRFPRDQAVFAQGEQPLYIYVHRRGKAALFHTEPASLKIGCTVEPDHIYGIIEALSDEVFKGELRAITDSEFDLIAQPDFLGFIHEHPNISFKLAQILSRFYQSMIDRLRSH